MSPVFPGAAFQVMKVPLQDDPTIKKAWKKVQSRIQFSADVVPYPDTGEAVRLGVCLDFDHGELAFVEGVEEGYVAIDASPEYSSRLNDHMAVLQGLMT
ncbi:MAG: hypothetical protein R6V86_13550 [Spirochaetia bacterium]